MVGIHLRWPAISVFAFALAAMVAVAAAGEGLDEPGFPKVPVKFDIAAEPLSDALYAFTPSMTEAF